MARSSTSYIAAPDLWNEETRAALDAGTLRLQSGQWIKCGGNVPSRFHHHNIATGHVCAFHGHAKGSGQASRRYLAYVAGIKEEREAADKRKLMRERASRDFGGNGYTEAGRAYAAQVSK
jgi:hypothetical protein